MSREEFYERIAGELAEIEADGLAKIERPITTPQGASVALAGGDAVLNFCANNYLGLADRSEIVAAASQAMADGGFGMASVRFICGTTPAHLALESEIAGYLGTDDSITFAACFDANGAVFEPLLGAEDAIVSDSLNHASIIDGIRLSKAGRFRFESRNMVDLEAKLSEARSGGAKTVLIATDGVFSMDGFVADLAAICELADKYDALVMVDDCHATGVVGPQGRGTPALHGVANRVDIVTSTLGKSLGGAMGGFIAARQGVVDLLRQRARPYLFSNSLSPAMVGGARAAIRISRDGDDLRNRLESNAAQFRTEMAAHGFDLTGEGHPIIPVMTGDARVATALADRLGELGVYVTAFSFPVVPRGAARIRTQMNAAHSPDDIDRCVAAFVQAATDVGLPGVS